MRKVKRLGICFVIALLLASVAISPNFFQEKPQEERVEAFAPAIGVAPMLAGAGSLAAAPVAIGVGVAVGAVLLGVGIGKGVSAYRDHADEINATVVNAWNSASKETKKMWGAAAQEFIKKAKAGEKVVDAAGNYIVNVPKELTRYLSGRIVPPSNSKTGNNCKELTALLEVNLGQYPTKTLHSYTGSFQAIDIFDLPYYVTRLHELDGRIVDDYNTYIGLRYSEYLEAATLFTCTRYAEDQADIGNIPDLSWSDFRELDLSRDFNKILTIAMQHPDPRNTWTLVPKDNSTDKNIQKFVNTYKGNIAQANDNARKLLDGGNIAVPAPLCKIPRAFATGDNGKLSHDIVWDGSITGPNGDKIGGWVDGGKALTGSSLDSLGNLDVAVPGNGTAALNPDLTWTIPKVDDWAYNPGYVDAGVADKPIDLVNKGIGTNVLDDAKPIDDAVALNPPKTLPVPPAGAINPPAGGDTIHWEKLTHLGKNFTKIFPFCIPFDVGDYVAGSVDNLERKKFKKYEATIYKNYKVTLAIPEEFYPIGDIIRTILLVLYDVGLMYAVYKWFSALK